MKHKTDAGVILLLVLLVISFSTSSAAGRFLKPRHGEEGPLFNNIEGSILESESSEDMGVMGREECKDGDEGYCSERRMIVEAHLDYVYTQSQSQYHKP